MLKPLIVLASASVAIAGCENATPATGALGGGAMGAGVGAMIGAATGTAATGALIGAGVGAAGGAIKGCRNQGNCGASPKVNRRQYYDEHAGRYYYYDAGTGRYYWEDGSPRP
jgi:hypothetical protein